MASDITLSNIRGRVERLTAKAGAAWRRGDLIGYDSGWVKADSSVATPIYAQLVALGPADGSNEADNLFNACRSCDVYDADAPFTAVTAQYLSGTAGAITETRPATDGDLIQVVGHSLDTSHMTLELQAPVEFEMFIKVDILDTSGEPGLGLADAGWPGPSLTGTETARFKGRLPSGLVGSIQVADIILNSINASAGDLDITIVGGFDGASNVQDTGTGITATDWDQADTDDIILTVDISANFDAGFYLPSRNFAVFLDPDVLTADAQVLGLNIRGWKLP